ncbi:superoxide dismutase [Melghiribacillus thermohalophilus]|uniref:superoxide dismutase n=1 Tax=Melghiribacillus thermohalophilus TaxID=1324956 RepID=A0A4V2V2L7_9BACI|nr:superoxide dismutase [Melghiribacillus thermohalophilus]TCT25625.1 superoxide dismutase [Melghiribacillus thermohalophilus]
MTAEAIQYLKALLNWADEVEEKIRHNQPLASLEIWRKDFHQWKNDIEKMLEQHDQIPPGIVREFQHKGEQLVKEMANLLSPARNEDSSILPGQHVLPPLPYEYDALEPYISREIMKLHHSKHHKSYVEGLNQAEKMIHKWSKSKNHHMLRHWMREQSFNGSGHFLHTIFFSNMSPKGGGRPSGELFDRIERDFGSYDRFKKLFTEAAQSVQGNGWAMLVWELRSGRLAIHTTERHHMFALWDVIPLLVLDLWEHAYYIQYKTDRTTYINNWFHVVCWNNVSKRFAKAKKLKWQLA